MMKLNKICLLLLTISLTGISCNQLTENARAPKIAEGASLKSTFKNDFFIGAAIGREHINRTEAKGVEIIEREFNTITPENVMKWRHIHPSVDSFSFEMGDQFVELGKKNKQHLIGHTLIWHSQIAPWMDEIKDSTQMANLIENHINAIVGHYKGKIDAWDVVNEALNEDGTFRRSNFYEVMGERYLELAFKLAAAADPEVELIYNEPNLQEIENSIIAYADLGVKVMFTELDITVLPDPWGLDGAEVSQNFEGSEAMNPYPEGLPDSMQVKLAERYEEIFKLFLKHKDKISRVTFWGVHDGHSWLNDWPIKGRTNYPLFFDRNFAPKLVYEQVLKLKEKAEKY